MNDLFYENGKIKITKNVFANGAGENYVIANIKHVRDERKTKSVLPLILGAVLGLAAGIHTFFSYSEVVLGGISGLFVIMYFMSKDKFMIYLTTPAGEVRAFVTQDESVHADVVRCLKRAVSAHS